MNRYWGIWNIENLGWLALGGAPYHAPLRAIAEALRGSLPDPGQWEAREFPPDADAVDYIGPTETT